MAEPRSEVRLSREMRLIDVTMIGVGAMIGAGVFVLTGIAAGVAGPALILAFFLNGIVTVFTAMVYAELGSCFHTTPAGAICESKGLPDPNGFLLGLMGYHGGHDLPLSLEKLLAAAVVVVFGYINYRGASETGKAGNIVTVAKIAVLASSWRRPDPAGGRQWRLPRPARLLSGAPGADRAGRGARDDGAQARGSQTGLDRAARDAAIGSRSCRSRQ